MTLTLFMTIYVLHLLAAISPGPAVLMSARIGISEGLRTGIALSVGIGIGGMIWAMAALFGLNIIFEAAPSLLTALKIIGGAYLVYLAYKTWVHAADPIETPSGEVKARTIFSAFRLGLFTQLANPKPAVMFSAIFIGTVPQGTPLWIMGAILLAVFFNEALWNALVARVFSFEKTRNIYLKLKLGIDRCFGGILAILGIKIAIE